MGARHLPSQPALNGTVGPSPGNHILITSGWSLQCGGRFSVLPASSDHAHHPIRPRPPPCPAGALLCPAVQEPRGGPLTASAPAGAWFVLSPCFLSNSRKFKIQPPTKLPLTPNSPLLPHTVLWRRVRSRSGVRSEHWDPQQPSQHPTKQLLSVENLAWCLAPG